MPEPAAAGNRGMIAIILVMSAITLAVLAALIYMGVVPVSDEIRGITTLVVGGAAIADLVIAIWFFRMGQSS